MKPFSRFYYLLLGFILIASLILIFNNTPKKIDYPHITINSATFKLLIAQTYSEQAKGLSGLSSLPADQSMLFIFDNPGNHGFWMRGMKFPLDIIFLLDNKVVAVHENLHPAAVNDPNPPQWGSEVLADKVLEINAGLAEKYDIKVGDTADVQINYTR